MSANKRTSADLQRSVAVVQEETQETIAQLRKMLLRYACHLGGCKSFMPDANSIRPPCSCGLDTAKML